jgi:hypothetical protein
VKRLAALDNEAAQSLAFVDTTTPTKPLALKIRLTIDGESHQMSTVWNGFGWSIAATRIADGIRELMANAPRIVYGEPL